MRRLMVVLLLLGLAGPMAAQSVTCTQSKSTRLVSKGAQFVNGVLKTWYVSVDSTAGTCKGFPTGRVDTVLVPAPVDTTKPDTAKPPPVEPPPPAGVPEIPAGYTLRQTWTGNPMVPSGWAVSSVSNYSLVADPTAPVSSPVVQIRYPASHLSGNGPGRLEWNASAYQDVLVTYWFKYDPNFNGDQSSVNKHIFLFGCNNVLVYSTLRFTGNAASGSIDAIPENGAATNGFQWLAGVGGTRVSVSKTAWTRVTLEVTRSAVRLWANGTKVADRSISWNDNSCRYVKIDPTYGGNTGQTIGREGYLFLDDVRIYTR